jgi:hypothetical protein
MAKLGSSIDARLSRISPYAIRAMEMGGAGIGAGFESLGQSAGRAIKSYAEMKEEDERNNQAIESLTQLYTDEGYDPEKAGQLAQSYVNTYGAAGGMTEARQEIRQVKQDELEENRWTKIFQQNQAAALTQSHHDAMENHIRLRELEFNQEEQARKLDPDSPEGLKAQADLELTQNQLLAAKEAIDQMETNRQAYSAGITAFHKLNNPNLSDQERFTLTNEFQQAAQNWYYVSPRTGNIQSFQSLFVNPNDSVPTPLYERQVFLNLNDTDTGKPMFLFEQPEATPPDDGEKEVYTEDFIDNGEEKKPVHPKALSGPERRAGKRRPTDYEGPIDKGIAFMQKREERLNEVRNFLETMRGVAKAGGKPTPDQIEFYKTLDEDDKQKIDRIRGINFGALPGN